MLADESRLGGGCERIMKAAMRAANGLIDARLRYGTIGEWDLAKLPKSAKLVILPAPFALSEPAYQRLRTFVSGGGTLYVSGDISFDENRKRTQTKRLLELAGVKSVDQRYPDVRIELGTRESIRYDDGTAYTGSPAISFEPQSGRVIAAAKNRPVAVVNTSGKGHVFSPAIPPSSARLLLSERSTCAPRARPVSAPKTVSTLSPSGSILSSQGSILSPQGQHPELVEGRCQQHSGLSPALRRTARL